MAEHEVSATEQAAVMEAMTSTDKNGKSILSQYRDIFSMVEGKDDRDDVLVDTLQEGVSALGVLAQSAGEKAGLDTKAGNKWRLHSTPLGEFGKSLDDLYSSFLRWAVVTDANATGGGERSKYNVSKAFRRFESYVSWMDDAEDDLLEPPLTASSVARAHHAWQVRVSYDAKGRLLWWFDVGLTNLSQVRQLTPKDTVRFFTWFSHFVMFDDAAQTHGIAYVVNFAKIGLRSAVGLVPMQLWAKLDGLTIGVMPLHTMEFLTLGDPVWYTVMITLLSPFLSRKLRARMVSLRDFTALVDMLGTECIPQGFSKCEGHFLRDPVEEQFFS